MSSTTAFAKSLYNFYLVPEAHSEKFYSFFGAKHM